MAKKDPVEDFFDSIERNLINSWRSLINNFELNKYATYNPFNLKLKSKSFAQRWDEMKRIFVGKNKENFWKKKFGILDYLIGAPVHLTTNILRLITLGVYSGALLLSFVTLCAVEKLWQNTFTRILLSPVLFLMSFAFLAVSAVTFAVDKFVDYVGSKVRQATNKLLIPFLGHILSPITLLLASIAHAGYGMAGLVSKRKADTSNPVDDDSSGKGHDKMTRLFAATTRGNRTGQDSYYVGDDCSCGSESEEDACSSDDDCIRRDSEDKNSHLGSIVDPVQSVKQGASTNGVFSSTGKQAGRPNGMNEAEYKLYKNVMYGK